jgi:hypothetical protein
VYICDFEGLGNIMEGVVSLSWYFGGWELTCYCRGCVEEPKPKSIKEAVWSRCNVARSIGSVYLTQRNKHMQLLSICFVDSAFILLSFLQCIKARQTECEYTENIECLRKHVPDCRNIVFDRE